MSSFIKIPLAQHETRVALLETGSLLNFTSKRTKDRGSWETSTREVVKVLPGMQLLLLTSGLEKAAFLYVSDVHRVIEDMRRWASRGRDARLFKQATSSQIEDLLHEGQELLGSGLQRTSRHERNPDHFSHHFARQVSCLHCLWWTISVFREGSRMKKNGRG